MSKLGWPYCGSNFNFYYITCQVCTVCVNLYTTTCPPLFAYSVSTGGCGHLHDVHYGPADSVCGHGPAVHRHQVSECAGRCHCPAEVITGLKRRQGILTHAHAVSCRVNTFIHFIPLKKKLKHVYLWFSCAEHPFIL